MNAMPVNNYPTGILKSEVCVRPMKIKVEVRKKRANWYWRIVNSNGKIALHSEQYSKKGNAQRAAEKFFTTYLFQDRASFFVQDVV